MRLSKIGFLGVALLAGAGCDQKKPGTEAVPAVAVEPTVPATVTVQWCGQLRQRLQDRHLPQARAKYPNRGADFVERVTTEYVRNLEYNCQQDVGKPTEGKWQCHWDSSFDNYEQCDRMGR